MESGRTVKYICPYCRKEMEIEVFDKVNAQEDPDLQERCASGDLFKTSCPHCKQDFMVQYPLVYIDTANKFILWLSQEEHPEIGNLTRPLIQQGYRLRRCSTIREFTEKIAIFEDGMDDVVVELAKYDSFIEFIDNKKGTAEEITSIEYQRCENEVMKINIRTGDQGMSFLIPVGMVEEEIAQNPELYEIRDDEIPLINSDWILSLFEESAGQA